MRILLVNPPLSEPAGPYPAIAYLAGFLRTIGRSAELADASLTVLLRLFSAQGVRDLEAAIRRDHRASGADALVATFLDRADWYVRSIDTAISCLQGGDSGAPIRVLQPGFLPAPLDEQRDWARRLFYDVDYEQRVLGTLTTAQRARIATRRPMPLAFGSHGQIDGARFLASGMVRDLATVVQRTVAPDFSVQAYAEKLGNDVPTFAALASRLEQPPGFVDRLVIETAEALCLQHQPDLVGFSVPFAGNVIGALQMARQFKHMNPLVRTVMGGGWVNTTLRQLRDPGIFDLIDFITLDDGERPLQCLLEHLEGGRSESQLLRTFVRRDGRVQFVNGARDADPSPAEAGTPTYGGMPLRKYLNYRPAFRAQPSPLDLRWNKLTLAHGCYWKKCTFCDTSLDYIDRYEPSSVALILERIRTLIDETGESGFHFVDEAMPPSLLGRLAERLIAESLNIAWWGNVRFESALAPLASRLAESGCVELTGGLEVASDRLLTLMSKGVTLRQVAQVTKALSSAGIGVHAYLIYGFPTETEQETVDALEFVRQLFEAGYLRSAYWHRFALTRYSPVAADPERFGIRIPVRAPHPFGNYVLNYEEPGGIDHGRFSAGLRSSMAMFSSGGGLERPVHEWFQHSAPPTTLPADFVRRLVDS